MDSYGGLKWSKDGLLTLASNDNADDTFENSLMPYVRILKKMTKQRYYWAKGEQYNDERHCHYLTTEAINNSEVI